MKSLLFLSFTWKRPFAIITYPFLIGDVFNAWVYRSESVLFLVYHITVQYVRPLSLKAGTAQVHLTPFTVVADLLRVLAVDSFARVAVPHPVVFAVDKSRAGLFQSVAMKCVQMALETRSTNVKFAFRAMVAGSAVRVFFFISAAGSSGALSVEYSGADVAPPLAVVGPVDNEYFRVGQRVRVARMVPLYAPHYTVLSLRHSTNYQTGIAVIPQSIKTALGEREPDKVGASPPSVSLTH